MAYYQSFAHSRRLQEKAHLFIPGGCHTYAKGDDQYPELAPGFISHGRGCHVWDVDGNEFIEYGMGLRAVTLGHACEPVVMAAYEQMIKGSNFTRPAPIEAECAEALLGLIDADQVKFAKDGSTVTTAAVKLARAYTGREMVAICADHPFFSYNDWFIGTTPMTAGIPEVVRSLTVKFRYNDIYSLDALFAEHPDRIACVVLEPARIEEPSDGFLQNLRALCSRHGAILIFDEMITGFRWSLGGAQKTYNVVPDLATFGKGMANGFSVSALVGKRDIMELGGLRTNKERVFLLSTTHGAETHCLAAAVKTIQIYRDEPVIQHLYKQGERLRRGIQKIVDELNMGDFFILSGRPCNLIYETRDHDCKPSQPFRTLFLQELIKRGILAPSFVVSFSHSNRDIDRTVEVAGEALHVYGCALKKGIDSYLVGPSVKPVFRKYI